MKSHPTLDRGDASHHAGGLGLGLFISRQLVAAHRGTIALERPPAAVTGARFVVRLPRNAAAPREEALS